MTSINTNTAAFFAQQNLRSAQSASTNSIGRLSSGDRIIRAADDVAGLSIGTILATNVNSLKTAFTNTQQANSLLQIADGGLDNITSILQRQKSLAVQATAGTLSASERGFLNQEFQNLADEIDRLVDNTKFNEVSLLDGSIFDDAQVSTNTVVIGGSANSATANAPANTGTVATLREGVVANQIDTYVNAINSSNTVTNSGFSTVGTVNNAAFVGEIESRFDVTYISTSSVFVTIDVGNVRYSQTVNTAAGGAVTFNGVEIGGPTPGAASGNFVLNTNVFAIPNEDTADIFESKLNSVLDNLTFYQNRTQNIDAAGLLSGATANLRLDNFEDTFFTDVRVSAATATETGLVEVDLRDEVNNTTTTFQFQIAAGGAITAGAQLFTPNNNGVTETDQFTLTTAGNLSIDTADEAAQLEDALKYALSIGTGASGLTFQTGASVTDTIDVKVKGLSTDSLYGGQNLNVLTVADAQAASQALDVAIQEVTSIRADVGALQSRFDFAGANLQTSIQNQDAAKGLFLDADISEESSAFAQSQVLLQASISVLAQANLQPQNLLKLIG